MDSNQPPTDTRLIQAIENNLLVTQEPKQMGHPPFIIISTETLKRPDIIPAIMGMKCMVLFTPHALIEILNKLR